MCQPFAISACNVIGTVRPGTTAGVASPTTVHLTGRNDALTSREAGSSIASGADTARSRGAALLPATNGMSRRNAVLFILLEIYAYGRDPCVYLHPPLRSGLNVPAAGSSAKDQPAILLRRLVRRSTNCNTLRHGIRGVDHHAAGIRQTHALQVERV